MTARKSTQQKKNHRTIYEDHKNFETFVLLVIGLWNFWGFSYSSSGWLDFGFYIEAELDLLIAYVSSLLVCMER